MDNIGITIALFLQTAVQMGTPLLFGTLGAMLCEKVGHLNLGVEGMMLMGAVMGFKIGMATGSAPVAIMCAGLAGAFGGLIYAVITITFRGNHTVTGLALTIFGTGFSGFLGTSLVGMSLPATLTAPLAIKALPGLSEIPIIGTALFTQSYYVYIAIIIAIIFYFYMTKTRKGLNMRAVGENPGAADASGINVELYKYVHIVLGGFLCGLGGAFYSLVFVPRWQENITAGAGWIAVALVIFSTWNPIKAIAGAYLFGALRGIGFKLQGFEADIFGMKLTMSPQLLDMIPYVMTILVLIMITLNHKKENKPPEHLGSPYFREDR